MNELSNWDLMKNYEAHTKKLWIIIPSTDEHLFLFISFCCSILFWQMGAQLESFRAFALWL